MLAAALGWLLAGCQALQPVRIGMAVELTGRRSEVGVAARNGAELAVEAVNAAGGVDGRPLLLLVQDDQGEPNSAQQADRSLAEAGVVAIIGHITSAQTAAALEQIDELGLVLISPASSSSEFSGKDDLFFRLTSANEQVPVPLARHLFNTRLLRRAVVVYDLSNRSFTETWWTYFAQEFEALGGTCQALPYTSGETDLRELVQELKGMAPQAVVWVASAVDTAIFLQCAAQ